MKPVTNINREDAFWLLIAATERNQGSASLRTWSRIGNIESQLAAQPHPKLPPEQCSVELDLEDTQWLLAEAKQWFAGRADAAAASQRIERIEARGGTARRIFIVRRRGGRLLLATMDPARAWEACLKYRSVILECLVDGEEQTS